MKNLLTRLKTRPEEPKQLTLHQKILYTLVIVLAFSFGLLIFTGSVSQAAQNGPEVQKIFLDAGIEPIDVIRSDDPSVNCGVKLSEGHGGGCFNTSTPDLIYISSNLKGEVLKYVVLHEYYHYIEFNNGWKSNELSADGWAVSKGADREYAYYLNQLDDNKS